MNSNTIILLSTGIFASTFGVYVAVRLIKRYTTSPENILVRSRGDIEMTDYIEPIRGQQSYNYHDLLAQPSPIHDRIPNYGRIPSYWSGNPPSYQTVDRVNCPLEDYINLDYILIWFILGVLLFFLVNYFWSKFLNSKSQTVFTNGISTEEITFRNNYQEILSSKLNKDNGGFFLNFGEIEIQNLRHGWTEEDIKIWLNSLNDPDYNVTIEILTDLTVIRPDWKLFSKEFIVNYNSNHNLIVLLIHDQLLELYNSIDIYSNYTIVIHYIPLTKTDFSFIESYYSKRERR